MEHRAFLVIGAMKAGTTSLFSDLAQNAAICLPEKEPAYLTRYSVPEAIAAYRRLFRGAGVEQVVGEASTGYSMLPRYPGVADRAVACFGPEVRIIYLVRNPLHRVLSHHYHAWSYGEANRNADMALREDPNLLAVSRYAMQLAPWREVVSSAQIRVIVAEEYYAARRKTLEEVCRFLGVPEAPLCSSGWLNRGEERRVGAWNRVRRAGWYRRHVADRVPTSIRARASRLLLAPGPPRPPLPSMDCLNQLCDALNPEIEALTIFMRRAAAPWDLTDTVRRMVKRP